MNTQNLLHIGDTMFLERKEVVITKIYADFNFAEIYYTGADSKFYVDTNTLTSAPDYTYSISLKYFGRSHDE